MISARYESTIALRWSWSERSGRLAASGHPVLGSVPATDRREACGQRRTGDGGPLYCPSGDPPTSTVQKTDRLDGARLDELAQRGFRDADMASDPDEPDTPFGDETAREALVSGQPIGHFGDCQQSVVREF